MAKYDKVPVKGLLEKYFGNNKSKMRDYLRKHGEEDMLWRVNHYNQDEIEEEAKEWKQTKGWTDVTQFFHQHNSVRADCMRRLQKEADQKEKRENDEWSDWDLAHALYQYLVDEGVFETGDEKKIKKLRTDINKINKILLKTPLDHNSTEYINYTTQLTNLETELQDELEVGHDVYDLYHDRSDGKMEVFEIFNGKRQYGISKVDDLDEVAKQYLRDQIATEGYLFNEDFIIHYIDGDKVADYMDVDDDVRGNLEAYFDDSDKDLSDDQTERISEIETEIQELENEQSGLDIDDPEGNQRYDEIQEQISELEDEKTQIEENPEGDVSEDKIEEKVNEKKEEIKYNPYEYLKDLGYNLEDNKEFFERFIDDEALISAAIQADGAAHFLNTYDGKDNEYKYNDEFYSILLLHKNN